MNQTDIILVVIALLGISLIVGSLFFLVGKKDGKDDEVSDDEVDGVDDGQAVNARDRGTLRRRRNNNSNNENNADDQTKAGQDKPKTKKQLAKDAKKAAKAEQKAIEERAREEKKSREEKKKAELQRREEERLEREREKAEQDAKQKEVEECQGREELDQWKGMFAVEGGGELNADDEGGTDREEDLLQQFIVYIKEHKVVVLEDLANAFRLKSSAAIDRVNHLLEGGRITGVIDDRGKFIYITPHEMNMMSSYVNRRGRVSISDVAKESNRLIKLTPEVQTLTPAPIQATTLDKTTPSPPLSDHQQPQQERQQQEGGSGATVSAIEQNAQ